MKRVRLLKWSLLLLLPLLFPVVALILFLTTESGFRLVVSVCDSMAGPAFSVDKVEGRVIDNWRLEGVRLRVDGRVDVAVEELRWSWTPRALIGKELLLESVSVQGLVLRLADSGDGTGDGSQTILPEIRFPIGLEVKDLQVHDAKIFFADSNNRTPFVVNGLILKASGQDDQLTIGQLKLDTPDYGGELQGSVQFRDVWPLAINGEWRVADPGIGDLGGSVDIKGDFETLAVSVGFKTPVVTRVEGELTDILNDLHWQVTGETEHFKLADIQVDQPIDGTLTVVKAFGTVKTYGGTLAADVRYQGYPQVHAQAEVQGDYNGLTISLFRFILDEARLTAGGQINWVDGFSWQAELEGEQLDPGRFVPQWPGAVDILLQSHGTWTAEALTADVNIESLQGELRGFPLVGSGRAGVAADTIRIDGLQLQSGSSGLRIDGHVGKKLDLSFQAGSNDLASFIPQSSGAFELRGTVGGIREHPRLTITGKGSGLNVDGTTVQSLEATVDVDLSDGGTIDADVSAGGVEIQGKTISTAHLQVRGSFDDHQINLLAVGSPGELQFAAGGALDERQWRGEVAELQLRTAVFGAWKTEQPVSLLLAEKNIEVSQFTLIQDQTKISLAGRWRNQDGWQVHGGVDNFSLDLLERWNLVSQKLDGVLTASISAAGQGVIPKQAELNAAVPDISLTVEGEDDETEMFQWTDNALQLTLTDGKARLTVKTFFQDGSTVDLDVAATNCCDVDRLDKIPLDGKLDVRLADISPLAPLSGYMATGKGRFAGSFSLQGTVASPTLQGSMALADGEIMIPDVGLAVQELELSVAGDATANRVGLTLVSDGSRLKAEGEVRQDSKNQWQADFRIRGKDFQAVHRTDYQATVSPDLHLIYGKEGTVLSGTVTVAKARIAPQGFSGAVSSSRDIVVIDADGAQNKNGLPLFLDLEVIMGEEVEVDAFGVKGYLDGRLKIDQKPGRAMTGLGTLSLREGTFVFKSTNLRVSRGRVFYQGGPIDDPGLDVQAGREVDGNEVGVQVTGSVSRMEMNLFSSPPMDDSDIVASLLTGQSMSTSGTAEGSMLGAAAGLGIGKGGDVLKDITKETGFDVNLAGGEEASDISLVIGREIYKDLYISYGKGLADSVSTFKAGYKLKYGFSVETETTSEATGTDLFWSLER